ncbi:unnamed protein product [Brassicogethes aeneus]|uniref:Uncharacterized protein n=1 Tax=Brassicogethes aeneus TaxID=1431903 RepID=A0A9P0B6A0_BRAAE|nr:unnamed protein product [Brassicogethes aeneus]
MFKRSLFKINQCRQLCFQNPYVRLWSTENKNTDLGNMNTKYQVFKDNDSEIILDVYEERLKYSNLLDEHIEENVNLFEGLNLKRGKTGVFEIEDLVEVLKRENSKDIFVAKVSLDIKYVDYMCVVSGKSQRHMRAIAQFVKRVYKQKKQKSDIVPKLEGENSKDWIALDLGKKIINKKKMSHRDPV